MGQRNFNPIQDGLFRSCSRMGEGQKGTPFPKICHTYPTMMKRGTVIPYPKKHVTHPLNSANISIFLLEISKFCYIKEYRYRSHFDT